MKHILPHLVLFALVCSLVISCSEEKTGEAAPPPSVIEKPKLTAKVEPEPVKVDADEAKPVAPRPKMELVKVTPERLPITLPDTGGPIICLPPPHPSNDDIIDFPEIDAQFPGGSAAMKLFIQQNIQYPEISKERGDQGRVYVSFLIEKDGSVSNVQIPRSLTEELDKEAKRVVRAMPKWIPGESKGEVVRSRARLPITFTME